MASGVCGLGRGGGWSGWVVTKNIPGCGPQNQDYRPTPVYPGVYLDVNSHIYTWYWQLVGYFGQTKYCHLRSGGDPGLRGLWVGSWWRVVGIGGDPK